jgi:hypothetical protein
MKDNNGRQASWLQRLQRRWSLQSSAQVWVILLVFACTGTTAVYIKKPLFSLLGIDAHTPWYWRTFWWLLIVLPAYQVLLLFYGFLFGQFHFFYNFEKRLFTRLLGCKKKPSTKSEEKEPST